MHAASRLQYMNIVTHVPPSKKQWLIPSGNPILILLWILVVFGGGWAYFYWLPAHYSEKGEQKPSWLQDVGDFQVSVPLARPVRALFLPCTRCPLTRVIDTTRAHGSCVLACVLSGVLACVLCGRLCKALDTRR